MPLFSRKKSTTNVSSYSDTAPSSSSSPYSKVYNPSGAVVGPSVTRLELGPELSTPLYARFARASSGDDANGNGNGNGNNRISLGMFDGSSVAGPNARAAGAAARNFDAAAVQHQHQLSASENSAPPSAFRSLVSPSSSPVLNHPKPQAIPPVSVSNRPSMDALPSSRTSVEQQPPSSKRESLRMDINSALSRRTSQQTFEPPQMPASSRSTATPSPKLDQRAPALLHKFRSQTLDSSQSSLTTTTTTDRSNNTRRMSAVVVPGASSANATMFHEGAKQQPPLPPVPPPSPPPASTSYEMSFYSAAVQSAFVDSPSSIHAPPIPTPLNTNAHAQNETRRRSQVPNSGDPSYEYNAHYPTSSPLPPPPPPIEKSIVPQSSSRPPIPTPSPKKHKHRDHVPTSRTSTSIDPNFALASSSSSDPRSRRVDVVASSDPSRPFYPTPPSTGTPPPPSSTSERGSPTKSKIRARGISTSNATGTPFPSGPGSASASASALDISRPPQPPFANQRPGMPSSPPVSGSSAGTPPNAQPPMLKRRSNSIQSFITRSGSSPDKEKSGSGLGWFASSSGGKEKDKTKEKRKDVPAVPAFPQDARNGRLRSSDEKQANGTSNGGMGWFAKAAGEPNARDSGEASAHSHSHSQPHSSAHGHNLPPLSPPNVHQHQHRSTSSPKRASTAMPSASTSVYPGPPPPVMSSHQEDAGFAGIGTGRTSHDSKRPPPPGPIFPYQQPQQHHQPSHSSPSPHHRTTEAEHYVHQHLHPPSSFANGTDLARGDSTSSKTTFVSALTHTTSSATQQSTAHTSLSGASGPGSPLSPHHGAQLPSFPTAKERHGKLVKRHLPAPPPGAAPPTSPHNAPPHEQQQHGDPFARRIPPPASSSSTPPPVNGAAATRQVPVPLSPRPVRPVSATHTQYDDIAAIIAEKAPPPPPPPAPHSASPGHANAQFPTIPGEERSLASASGTPEPRADSPTKKRRHHRSDKDKDRERTASPSKHGHRHHRSKSKTEPLLGPDGSPLPTAEADGESSPRKHRSHHHSSRDKDKDRERRHRHRSEKTATAATGNGSSTTVPMGTSDSTPPPTGSISDALSPSSINSFTTPTPPGSSSGHGHGPTNGMNGEVSPAGTPLSAEFASTEGAGEKRQRSHRSREEREKDPNRKHRHHKHSSTFDPSSKRRHRHRSPEPEREPRYYPLAEHLCNPELLTPLVQYLTFRDWYALWTTTKLVMNIVEDTDELREPVMERFLGPVGYRTWAFDGRREPVSLTLAELNAYLRGVNVPTHHYPMIAADDLHLPPNHPRVLDVRVLSRQMAASTRAYTKLVIRLRAQAELEQVNYDRERDALGLNAPPPPVPPLPHQIPIPRAKMPAGYSTPPISGQNGMGRYGRMNGSTSSFSDSGHGSAPNAYRMRSNTNGAPPRRSASVARSVAGSMVSTVEGGHGSYGGGVAVRGMYRFRSPLLKLGHAPLLRVFVPNQGPWLSDDNIVRCEQELGRAGVTPFLKVGDVVWDLAVGDEGNIGRMIWDGQYLIDLDYTYSLAGEIPPYIDSLCFPPSYWHKILRIAGDPIVHIDLQPYAHEIAANLSLLQSRVQAESSQGSYHTVVRWIHRSSFQLRGETPLLPQRSASGSGRTPLIDVGWEGTVFIEAEGTNEGLDELQDRCGPEVRIVVRGGGGQGQFAPPPLPSKAPGARPRGKTVFRMIRAQSRPGELWLRCAREKEKVMS